MVHCQVYQGVRDSWNFGFGALDYPQNKVLKYISGSWLLVIMSPRCRRTGPSLSQSSAGAGLSGTLNGPGRIPIVMFTNTKADRGRDRYPIRKLRNFLESMSRRIVPPFCEVSYLEVGSGKLAWLKAVHETDDIWTASETGSPRKRQCREHPKVVWESARPIFRSRNTSDNLTEAGLILPNF